MYKRARAHTLFTYNIYIAYMCTGWRKTGREVSEIKQYNALKRIPWQTKVTSLFSGTENVAKRLLFNERHENMG